MKNVLKKFTTALITLTMCIGTAGCTTKKAAETTNVEKVIGAQKLTNLGQNEILVIGDDQFKNIEYSEEKYSYLTYTNAIEYNLVRTSYSSSSYVSYGSYYYYWEISKHNDELLLGKQTDTYIVTYEYLVYENSETILVKTKQEKSVSYNYNGGWKSIEPEYTFTLNGYFESINDLKAKCPDLMKDINLDKEYKYFIDTTTPKTITYNTNVFDEYYYVTEIEK